MRLIDINERGEMAYKGYKNWYGGEGDPLRTM